jgi:hypothetical protein
VWLRCANGLDTELASLGLELELFPREDLGLNETTQGVHEAARIAALASGG